MYIINFSEIYSGLLVLPIDYCKSFMPFYQVKYPMQKWQASKGYFSRNGKPYKKVSNNRFYIVHKYYTS